MKLAFTDLNLGYSNAENYRRKENKFLLTRYFVKDEYLERLLNSSVYFLVGEKGTGKTAYAAYLCNNDYKGHSSHNYDVGQTEYRKFIEMKRAGHLSLSNYSDVWKTILLMASASAILAKSGTPDFLKRFTKLANLKRAIDEFYNSAFAPELVKMITFVESGDLSTSIIAKHGGFGAEAGGKAHVESHDPQSKFQINLLRIQQAFESAISNLKLDSNNIIFIDGIDVRPGSIPYDEYFECVQGLVEAIWLLNTSFLANIKDSKGRIRIVLLIRPDIFLRANLHNVNTKIRDNTVFLDWSTSYKDYRTSLLFKVADRLLANQQAAEVTGAGLLGIIIFRFMQGMSTVLIRIRKWRSTHFWLF